MTILGLGENQPFEVTSLMKYLIISSVTLKSAITPSFIGLIAVIFCGERPSMVFALAPTARISVFG